MDEEGNKRLERIETRVSYIERHLSSMVGMLRFFTVLVILGILVQGCIALFGR